MRSRRFLPVLLAVASAWTLTAAPASAEELSDRLEAIGAERSCRNPQTD